MLRLASSVCDPRTRPGLHAHIGMRCCIPLGSVSSSVPDLAYPEPGSEVFACPSPSCDYAPLMNRQALFDRHVRELAACVDNAWDEYQLLTAAGKVRTLLIDGGNSLIHEVNRQRRKRIVFEVRGETPHERAALELQPRFWSKMDGLSPRLAIIDGPIESLRLDAFLAHRVAVAQGHPVSVRDVVLQLANVEGGVHAGQPRTELESHLQESNARLFVGGDVGAVARIMLGIAEVVAHSLSPLVTPSR